MAEYSAISRNVQNEKAFRSLNNDAKFLYFLVRTHSNMTSIGAMRASIPGLASEYKWTEARLKKAMDALTKAGYAEIDDCASCLIITDWFNLHMPQNSKVAMGWARTLDRVPECELLYGHIENLLSLFESKKESFTQSFIIGLPKPYAIWYAKRYPIHKHKQKQEHKQKQNPKELRGGGILESEDPEENKGSNGTGKPTDGRSRPEKHKIIIDYFRKYCKIPSTPQGFSTYQGNDERYKQLDLILDQLEASVGTENDVDLDYFATAIFGFSTRSHNKGKFDGLTEYICDTWGRFEQNYRLGLKVLKEKGILRPPITRIEFDARKAKSESRKKREEETLKAQIEKQRVENELRERPMQYKRWQKFLAGEDIKNPFLEEKFQGWQKKGVPDWVKEFDNQQPSNKI